jgi:putative heme-binding domain-containing protein
VPHSAAVDKIPLLITDSKKEIVRAALGASAAYDDPALTQAILAGFPRYAAEERTVALSVLTSRRSSGTALLDAVERKTIDAASVPSEMREKLRLVADAPLASRIDAVFGARKTTVSVAAVQEIERMIRVVSLGDGSVYKGRALFQESCAACHRFFNVGGAIGPDLTAFKRDDVASLLLAIVRPSAEIREGYEPFVLTMRDGTVHSGFLASQDATRVVLRDMAGLTVTVERSAIASLQGMGASLMPEGLLSGMDDAQIRDLFAYLRITQPLVGRE